jgi:hypothetical protein
MLIKKYDHSEYLHFESRYDLKYWGRVKFEYLSVNKTEFEDEIESIISFMKENDLNKLEILEQNAFQEFTINLTNLSKLTFLKELYISGGYFLNHDYLENSVQLEGLYISLNNNNKEKINLSKLRNLVYLEIANTVNNVVGFEKMQNLKTLILSKYSPKTKDFSEFDLPKLSSLELVSPKVNSLNGLENNSEIKCFTLFRCQSLTNIEAIKELTNLEYLTIDRCKNIADFSILKNNKVLVSLGIENCGSILDVHFVSGLQKLKTIGLIGTSIEDGNLEPLKNIEYVSITNKSQYNYICKGFKLIAK